PQRDNRTPNQWGQVRQLGLAKHTFKIVVGLNYSPILGGKMLSDGQKFDIKKGKSCNSPFT
ncbi:hypothetical protein KC221_21760, partial [Mycobacterium tuberculosis]|nr:hypothetical protein [Mycobacterium tuberculosis]